MIDPRLTEIARERWHGEHADAHLRIHPDLWQAMKAAAPPPRPDPSRFVGGRLGDLMSVPVVIDETLETGAWQLVGNADRVVREQGRPTFTHTDASIDATGTDRTSAIKA